MVRGQGDAATLTIQTEHRGVLLIDGEERAVLKENTPTTIAVPDGTHVIAIEAEGYSRWEERIDVTPGSQFKICGK